MNQSKTDSPTTHSGFLKSVIGDFYHEGKSYKIPFGRLKGMKLFYRKDINYHYLLGLMEKDQMDCLTQLFTKFGLDKKKIIVADVGANMGYYSVFFHKYLHPDARIFSFEPSEAIFPVLRKNLEINNIRNVTCIPKACADKSGEIIFYIGKDHHNSSIMGDWAGHEAGGSTKYVVPSVTLDDFFYEEKNESLPDLIKMDIEGGAVYALQGCEKCITEKRPFMLIESHTAAEDKTVGDVLLKYGYDAFRTSTKKWVIHKDRNYKDPDGVWGTMLLIPQELRNEFTEK